MGLYVIYYIIHSASSIPTVNSYSDTYSIPFILLAEYEYSGTALNKAVGRGSYETASDARRGCASVQSETRLDMAFAPS